MILWHPVRLIISKMTSCIITTILNECTTIECKTKSNRVDLINLLEIIAQLIPEIIIQQSLVKCPIILIEVTNITNITKTIQIKLNIKVKNINQQKNLINILPNIIKGLTRTLSTYPLVTTIYINHLLIGNL